MRDNLFKNTLKKFEPNRKNGFRETSDAVAKNMVLRKTHSQFGERISASFTNKNLLFKKMFWW